MRTPLIASAAALLALTAAPALAASAKDAPQPTTQNEDMAPERADTRYCVQSKTTGSRVARKVCKTRDQWMAENEFDPLAPKTVTR